MLVYFAHPIDQATRPMKVINEIRGLLAEVGISFFRPAGAFTVSDPPLYDLEIINRINRFSLSAADALVAWLPPDIPSLGVPAEIEEAIRSAKPTLILTEQKLIDKSVQLADWRDRGATVVAWDMDRASIWASRPTELRNLLHTRPIFELVDTSTFSGPSLMPGKAVQYGDPELLVVRDPAAKPLSRAHPTDAGIDLAILEDVTLRHGVQTMIPTGIRAAVPDGWWGLMKGRSSARLTHGLNIHDGVIDAGYTGELMIGATLVDLGASSITLKAGTRLAQYILIPAFTGSVVEVDRLPEHNRGERGYGSSGQ